MKQYVFYMALGFMLGGLMFSQWLPKLLTGTDIRALSGDGNPGAFNVFRHCGAALGLLCLSLDMLKGFIPVYIALGRLDAGSALFAPVMAAPVLGHALSPFERGGGGKCISTSFGVVFALMPYSRVGLILAALYVFFSTVVKIEPHSRRSMLVFGLFGCISAALLTARGWTSAALGCTIISAAAVIRHMRGSEKPGADRRTA